MKPVVLCEGPADIARLREIGRSLFGAQVQRNPPSAGAAGETRKPFLIVQGSEVEITAVEQGAGLPGQRRPVSVSGSGSGSD